MLYRIALHCFALAVLVRYCLVVCCVVLCCVGSDVSGVRLKRKFDLMVTVNPATRTLHVRSAVPEIGLRYDLDLNSTFSNKGKSKQHLLSSVLTLGPKLLHSFIMEVGFFSCLGYFITFCCGSFLVLVVCVFLRFVHISKLGGEDLLCLLRVFLVYFVRSCVRVCLAICLSVCLISSCLPSPLAQ